VAGTASSSNIEVARYFIGNPLGDLSFSSQIFKTRDGAGVATIMFNEITAARAM